MAGSRSLVLIFASSLCLVSGALAEAPAAPGQPAQAKHTRRHKAPAPPQLVLPPMSQNPLPQMPMDLLPSAPPKVGFQGGLLTIVAQNSTLGDILKEVHKLTGATIDVPPNANERVVTRLGPGAPRDVLASLLNGSSFNYVMLGSDTDPTAVSSVVLTAKSAGNQPPGAANNPPPTQAYVAPVPPQPFGMQQNAMQQSIVQQNIPTPQGVQPQTGDDNANGEDADASADDNADQEQVDPNGAQPEQPPQIAQPPNAGPKTPEQILEMMRRQQQPPGTPNPQQPPEN